MAGSLPQIEVPTEQADALPATVLPSPTTGAFGVGVGAGLQSAGDELFQIGHQQYLKAAEATAQQAEASFQTQAFKLRDEYRNLYGDKALGAHSQYSDAVEALRSKMANDLPSKYATSLFNNGSLRNGRLVQEGIDQHFEQQNKVFQFGSFKKLQASDAHAAAKLGEDYENNAAAIDEKIEGVYKRGLEIYSQSYSAADADALAKQDKAVAADALITGMAKNPALSKALAKYGDVIDAKQKSAAVLAMGSQEASEAAKAAIYGTPDAPIKAQSAIPTMHDADGLPDEHEQRARLDDYLKTATPENGRFAIAEFNRLRQDQVKGFQSAVKQRFDRVFAQGQGPQADPHSFQLDQAASADDLKWLQRNAPVNDDIVGKMNLQEIFDKDNAGKRQAYSAEHRRDAEVTNSNLSRLRVNLTNMAALDGNAFKKLQPTDLMRLAGKIEDYPGGFPSAQGLKQADAVLKELQGRNIEQLKSHAQDVQQEVKAAFPGAFSAAKRSRATEAATNFLLSEVKPDADRVTVRAQLKDFLKENWEDYLPKAQPVPQQRPQAQKAPAYQPPEGAVFAPSKKNPARGVWVNPKSREIVSPEVDRAQ